MIILLILKKIDENHTDISTFDIKKNEYEFSLGSQIQTGYYFYKDIFAHADLKYSYYNEKNTRITSIYSDYGSGINYRGLILHKQYQQDDILKNITNHSITSEFGVGIGRIYDGRFAYIAESFIRELQRFDLIKRKLTYNELYELTFKIYNLKQKHFIDHRIRRIKAMQEVTSYLMNLGVCDDLNVVGTVLLQDIWDYFPQEKREFGFNIKLLTGVLYYDRSEDETRKYNRESNYTDPQNPDSMYLEIDRLSHNNIYLKKVTYENYLSGVFEYSKPLNFNWQLSYAFEATILLDQYKKEKRYERVYLPEINILPIRKQYSKYTLEYDLKSKLSVEYFYDSKTSISLISDIAFTRYERNYDLYSETENYGQIINTTLIGEDLEFTTEGKIIYRISIPTTLNIKGGIKIISQKFTVDSFWQDEFIYASFSISHYIY